MCEKRVPVEVSKPTMYAVHGRCENCDFVGEANVAFGQPVPEKMVCPNCGCVAFVKLPELPELPKPPKVEHDPPWRKKWSVDVPWNERILVDLPHGYPYPGTTGDAPWLNGGGVIVSESQQGGVQ